MNEKLLQYLWNFKVFTHFDFTDTNGNPVEILDFGRWNTDSGPDFLMAKIKTKNIILAGNIELHVKSSDWIFHQHSKDPAYQNIILHVVFQNDADIKDFDDQNIPTLELRDYIDRNVFQKYENLLKENQFIPCEKIFSIKKIPINFHEENLLKKLEEKSLEIETDLQLHKNNYEAVMFHHLAYSFGLTVNALLFKQIAESIDFTIINKIRQNKTQLEALFFGISGWLENPLDSQMQTWKREFDFLKAKYNIPAIIIRPKFLRLRPPNFPTIRLSQFADLYFQHQNLFSKIISAQNTNSLLQIFKEIKASDYWNDHFNFGKISSINHPKVVTKDFIELIILNTILPVKYAYHKHQNENINDEILSFYSEIQSEKNSIIKEWKKLGLKTKTSIESQSLIYHFKNYCKAKNCLNCSIGFKILKES
ncbi:DUF2851 family protein [Chryseobacterium sp. Ch-15]|uniref:DUF2851 family protein n=1 Tax=Chryseobacterium muglaense TaxID=2893752 RepID=A0A9Q3UVR6_9FLAO|nr:DUF2851 family protein [Chryseobacterium muglaense]MBD3903650.1 DUF2851 family protein [Chryseobacterium muglaense]MCC9034721.1 DUF2851 family protein [Chryseobacterium muglaense]MCM2552984.1 DUF2851 family protein [Chryseobacterium muglaense]